MKNKPEDLDNVEWYYLIQYFGSATFQVPQCPVSFLIPILKYNIINRVLLLHHLQKLSTKNSAVRRQKKTKQLTGAKPYSQVSFEQVMTTSAKLITFLSSCHLMLNCCHLRETRVMVNHLLIWNFG